MATNIEIKARCPDPAAVMEKISRLPLRAKETDIQTDTFFQTSCGRLKLRESSLHGAILIPYMRPDESGPKRSDYTLIRVDDPLKTKMLLADILGVSGTVKKERKIFLYGNVRIHLDRVEGLGDFLEFEALVEDESRIDENRKKLDDLLAYFEIDEKDLIRGAYTDMLSGKSQ